jgi:hypothetical protein
MSFAMMAFLFHALLFDIRIHIFFFGAIDDSTSQPPLAHFFIHLYVPLEGKITLQPTVVCWAVWEWVTPHGSIILSFISFYPHSIPIAHISLSSNPQISSRFRISPLTNQWRVQAILIRLMIIIWGTR